MTRRTFLTTLSTAAAGFALDPERLLWVPSSMVKPVEWMTHATYPIGITPTTCIWWRNRDPAEQLDYEKLGIEEE